MKLLVFGKTGQLAQVLSRINRTGLELVFIGREEADLSRPELCGQVILDQSPDAVLNVAAYTAVDRAEEERELAFSINSTAPGAMAKACASKNIPIVHVSTDYVYDGCGAEPFSPDENVHPKNVYGCSKLSGEKAIRSTGARHLILRTSWIFSAYGNNFCKTLLQRGRQCSQLSVVADQVGGPTPAPALTHAIITATWALVEGEAGGTFNFAGSPDTSRADFAKEVFSRAGLECRVAEVESKDFSTPAQRPLNSRLDCSSFVGAFGVARPEWRGALDETLRELGVKE